MIQRLGKYQLFLAILNRHRILLAQVNSQKQHTLVNKYSSHSYMQCVMLQRQQQNL